MPRHRNHWNNPDIESAIVKSYMECWSAEKVATKYGCGASTVRLILKRHDVKKPRKEKPKSRLSHCRSKYCPALIVMLHNAFGWRTKKIAEVTGYTTNGVQNVLSRRGLTDEHRGRPNKSDFDLDQIEREYLDGATTYELGKKYGVSPTTISTWMRERGIYLGKGAHQEGRNGRTKTSGEFVYTERMQELNQRSHENGERRFIQRLAETQGGRFEYVDGFRDGGRLVATVRCAACGHEFVHSISEMDKRIWQCPKCVEAEQARRQQERDAQRYERMFAEIREYSLDKTCAECGSTFHSASPTAKYCSSTCRERARYRRNPYTVGGFRHYYHIKYGDAYRKYYDPSVTLKALYERDSGVCQICGEPCNWNDKEWGNAGPTYPSVDHIIPRAEGGEHTWENVQLAHMVCNSIKGARDDADVKEAMACA